MQSSCSFQLVSQTLYNGPTVSLRQFWLIPSPVLNLTFTNASVYYDPWMVVISCSSCLLVKVSLWAKRPIMLVLNSGFCSMNRLGVFLVPPGWDASFHHVLFYTFVQSSCFAFPTGEMGIGLLPSNMTWLPHDGRDKVWTTLFPLKQFLHPYWKKAKHWRYDVK